MAAQQERTCDVAVIGAGTAGIIAEKRARAAGAETLLIDATFSGTTCADVGCMPSKLLIAAADVAFGVSEAECFGITATSRIDGAAVMQRLRRHRDRFVQGVRSGFSRLPEGTCLRGRARFTGPDTLELDDGTRIRARAIVIATGSEPAVPKPFRALGARVLTNRNLFDLPDLPESVGVIGAGAVGIELAQALARLGVRVEVFDAGRTLAGLPEGVSAELCRILSREFAIHQETEPRAEPDGEGLRLIREGGSARFDRLLVAAGRPPQLDALDLEKAGLDLDDKGIPRFDPQTLQCGEQPIFIAGDANHERPLLHEAADEGAIAGENAARFPDLAKLKRPVPMAITFCRPDAAVIGTLPTEDNGLVTGCADYARQGRARVMGRAQGICEIYADRDGGRLRGAALCAPHGEHLAHELAWAISCGLSASEMLDLPFYHPTLEEGLKPALRQICELAATSQGQRAGGDILPGDQC
ncbi:dihydrolipoyl dehydrogenase [Pontibaca methylaminivorans]|uniref:Dihydrolipoamide dehydrogenase n=1 Tax=Pontibaca methylaminivorans TaxID=515897 RepID=A0A1R3X725_9RHOB|nr:dihydrolipoyl dehydrogenase [Pontibaca methylaminivorans]SIT86713.1 dihydrolipoamide dehydrogenase [Pontibaca methylaminivorans]